MLKRILLSFTLLFSQAYAHETSSIEEIGQKAFSKYTETHKAFKEKYPKIESAVALGHSSKWKKYFTKCMMKHCVACDLGTGSCSGCDSEKHCSACSGKCEVTEAGRAEAFCADGCAVYATEKTIF